MPVFEHLHRCGCLLLWKSVFIHLSLKIACFRVLEKKVGSLNNNSSILCFFILKFYEIVCQHFTITMIHMLISEISPSESGCFYDVQCAAVWPDAFCRGGQCLCPSEDMIAVKTKYGFCKFNYSRSNYKPPVKYQYSRRELSSALRLVFKRTFQSLKVCIVTSSLVT